MWQQRARLMHGRKNRTLSSFDFTGLNRKATGFSLSVGDLAQDDSLLPSYTLANTHRLSYQRTGPNSNVYWNLPVRWYTGKDGWYYLGHNWRYERYELVHYNPDNPVLESLGVVSGKFYEHPEELHPFETGSITAHVYRGNMLVAEVPTDENGLLMYTANPETVDGITAVILKNSNPGFTTSFGVSSFSLTGDTNAPPVATETLSPLTNSMFGEEAYAFPPFNPKTRTELVEVAERFGITHWDSSRDFPMAGTTLGMQHTEGTYQRFDLASLGGSGARITGILSYNEHGAYPLPPDLYALYGPSTVVIASGAPRHLALQTAGSGKIDVHPQNGVENPAAAIPEQRSEVSVDIEHVRGPNGHTNFVQDVQVTNHAIAKSEVLFPGSTYGIKAIIGNPGVFGSMVTIQAVAGVPGREERFLSPLLEIYLEPHQQKEFWTDVTIPDGEGQPFVGVILILPDGRSADELDIGRLMSEKQEYVKQDLDNLDKARRKAEAALLAVANGGGDARLRHLFKNPTQTIAKLQNQRTALAALKQELVFGPIKRALLTATLDTAAGGERPEKEPKEPATLLAEKKKEKLAVKGAGLREGGEEVRGILLASAQGCIDINPECSSTLLAAIQNYPLNIPREGGGSGTKDVNMLRGTSATITFTTEEPMMVNFWLDAGEQKDGGAGFTGGIALSPNFSLSLPVPSVSQTYESEKKDVRGKPVADSAESISTVLPPGTYALAVRDRTDLSDFTPELQSLVTLPKNIPIHFDIQPYRTQEIVGRVSIPENPKALPVSMRVAEFEEVSPGEYKRKENYKSSPEDGGVHPLDPTKPVWVVMHGMNSSENEDKIDNLSQAFHGYAETEEIQLVTVNWDEGAKDIVGMGRDAPWTEAVGTWTARQLIAAGIHPTLVDGIGHSHGTYVLYALGKELLNITGKPMNTLIALDPAGNIPLISNFDHGNIDFSSVARNSMAFEGSIIADSDWLASTASTAFRVESPSTILPTTEHQLGLTAFTEILNHERVAGGHFSNYFSFHHIMNQPGDYSSQYVHNVYEGNPDVHPGGEFEGVIEVWVSEETGKQGNYFQAQPSRFRFRKPGIGQEQIISFDSFA